MEHRPVDLDEIKLKAALSDLPLGGLRVFRTIGSTNDNALAWASEGAADLSLVVADGQTAGRGRSGRTWITPTGSALALSLILRADIASQEIAGRLTGLGAMAVAEACDSLGLSAAIKWPNDVLVGGKKVAGILVEARWSGNQLQAFVIGIGINVLSGSTPPKSTVLFPATCMEAELGHSLNRIDVLHTTVSSLIDWRARINTDDFVRTWERRLAYRGQEVTLTAAGQAPIKGSVVGLELDGSLRLAQGGKTIAVQIGEIHLHPTDDRMT